MTWYVPRDQVGAYVAQGAYCSSEGSTTSATIVRNNIIRAAWRSSDKPPIVMLDDDLRRVHQADLQGGKQEISVRDALAIMVDRLVTSRFHLAGAAPVANAYFAKRAVSHDLFIRSGVMAITQPAPRFDESLILKADYDYTCQHLQMYGGVVRCDDLLFDFAQRTNKGGVHPLRSTPAANDMAVDLLLARWPQYLRRHATRAGELTLRVRARTPARQTGGATMAKDVQPDLLTSADDELIGDEDPRQDDTPNGSGDPVPDAGTTQADRGATAPPGTSAPDGDLFTSPDDDDAAIADPPAGGHKIAATLIDRAIPITTPTPHPDNPRRGDVPAIMHSLDRYGQVRPILVQLTTGHIIAGNHTYLAAKRLGWDQIAAVIVDMDDATALKYLLADNKTADRGKYEETSLYAMLQTQMELGDLDATGYTMDDVESLAAQLSLIEETAAGEFVPASYADNTAQEERVAKRKTEQLREVILMMPQAQAEELGVWISALSKQLGTTGVTATVLAAVRMAHDELTSKAPA